MSLHPTSGSADVIRGSRSKRVLAGFGLGCAISLVVVVIAEIDRWSSLKSVSGIAWLFDMNVDTTPFAVLFTLLPVFWLIRQPILANPNRLLIRIRQTLADSPEDDAVDGAGLRAAFCATFVGIVALLACLRVADTPLDLSTGVARYGDLPPAYHDEYSYLFQAQTFLAGRLSFPSHPDVPRIFDQMHVLNEGRFASRYFPGTGLWIAPFLAFGSAHAGHIVATLVICVLLFLIGRELSCNGVGLLAGVLAALSPGLELFGNLLLAHQPTLVGLGVFILAFLKLQSLLSGNPQPDADPASMRKAVLIRALVSGSGLTFAMLCRPMSAAGVGLPFGVWLAVWLVRHFRTEPLRAPAVVIGFAIPLLAGFGLLGIQNHTITGSVLKSPYQLYTELFTPSHMYGFDNAERAKPLMTPRVLKHYDDWAAENNLDAELAMQNVGQRLLASWQWTLSIVALVISGCVFAAGAYGNLKSRWWLIVAGIGTLHLLHVPYWFVGIMNWHYVFESGVLWCLTAAAATQILVRLFEHVGRPWMSVWWMLLILASISVNQFAVRPFWGISRVEAGIDQSEFSRVRFERLRHLIDTKMTKRPALLLIKHDPTDRHIDYVNNHPSLKADVLIGRFPADSQTSDKATIDTTLAAFPDRTLYTLTIDPETKAWSLSVVSRDSPSFR